MNQEVSIRAKAVGHFFDQFSADLLTLAASRTLKELNIARAHGNQAEIEAAVKRLETRYIWVTPRKEVLRTPKQKPRRANRCNIFETTNATVDIRQQDRSESLLVYAAVP